MTLRDATFSKTYLSVATPKISLTCCTVTGAVYQNVLDCERRMASFTYKLTLSLWEIRICKSCMTNSKTVDKVRVVADK